MPASTPPHEKRKKRKEQLGMSQIAMGLLRGVVTPDGYLGGGGLIALGVDSGWGDADGDSIELLLHSALPPRRQMQMQLYPGPKDADGLAAAAARKHTHKSMGPPPRRDRSRRWLPPAKPAPDFARIKDDDDGVQKLQEWRERRQVAVAPVSSELRLPPPQHQHQLRPMQAVAGRPGQQQRATGRPRLWQSQATRRRQYLLQESMQRSARPNDGGGPLRLDLLVVGPRPLAAASSEPEAQRSPARLAPLENPNSEVRSYVLEVGSSVVDVSERSLLARLDRLAGRADMLGEDLLRDQSRHTQLQQARQTLRQRHASELPTAKADLRQQRLPALPPPAAALLERARAAAKPRARVSPFAEARTPSPVCQRVVPPPNVLSPTVSPVRSPEKDAHAVRVQEHRSQPTQQRDRLAVGAVAARRRRRQTEPAQLALELDFQSPLRDSPLRT